MKIIDGGVTAAKGFKANGVHCGIRKNTSKKDLALIVSDIMCTAAAVYTTNLVKGAPLTVTKSHLENGKAQAVICNSGNANTCNANGIEIAEEMCSLAAKQTALNAGDIIVASTGVIGQELSCESIKNSIGELAGGLAYGNSLSAAQAIMTTDTIAKEAAAEFEIGGKICRVGGIAKGSGMIHPNMATMLVFITCDAAISSDMLNKALKEDIKDTFNMVTVDGDTSTNDMVSVMCNGLAQNPEINKDGDDFNTFKEALNSVTKRLCKMIAKDGEGATKLLIAKVSNAKTKEDAKIAAKSVVSSSLLKAAMFGADANWGRVLCAIGYSKADVDINKIDVSFTSKKGTLEVCKNGAGIEFSEEKAKEILLCDEIDVNINLNDGEFYAEAYGCDLTYDYVKINGDYRT